MALEDIPQPIQTEFPLLDDGYSPRCCPRKGPSQFGHCW